jgi:hypothetical protein
MNNWISVKDKLPRPYRKVLALYRYGDRLRTIIAGYVPKSAEDRSCELFSRAEFLLEESNRLDKCGWYENIETAQDFFRVAGVKFGVVEYWQELPNYPEGDQ